MGASTISDMFMDIHAFKWLFEVPFMAGHPTSEMTCGTNIVLVTPTAYYDIDQISALTCKVCPYFKIRFCLIKVKTINF